MRRVPVVEEPKPRQAFEAAIMDDSKRIDQATQS
jgi:hypothetical protein